MAINNYPPDTGDTLPEGQEIDQTSDWADVLGEDAEHLPRSDNSFSEITNSAQSDNKILEQLTQDWEQLASFTLEFQIRSGGDRDEQQVVVQHIESDQEKIWKVLDHDAIYPWIMSRVGDALEQLPLAAQPIISPPGIVITQVKFLQPLVVSTATVVDESNALLEDVLHSSEPVALEIEFKLVGLFKPTNASSSFQIQGKFHNRVTGDNVPVGGGQAIHLTDNQHSYTARLPEIMLVPGPYRLQIVATLHHASIPPALFEVPILQVV